ncbi:MAG TPA: cytochrome c oxidase subunit 3 [Pyrinomonadaceae bacterium]
MDTTVTSNDPVGRAESALEGVRVRARGGGGGRGGRGGGGGGNGKGPGGGGGGGGGSRRDGWTPSRYRIGVFVGIASILMMFSALASALIVRMGLPGQSGLPRTPVPSFLWVSTALIVLSSVTIAVALRALKRDDGGAFRLWLGATLVLGLGFLSAQLLAWRQLVAQGFYLASNPHSSFFYVLTGLHGIHLVGGIAGLAYLLARALRAPASGARGEVRLRTLADVVAIYWHFMDGLWVFLFLLLFLWR